ncbi:MAG TPA: type IV toxin-antitoxin system AbiEi family antitoxin domain-containing protein [Solirubrobacterales bacterium]
MWADGQNTPKSVWAIAERQHGVVTRGQLLEIGLTRRAVEHRLRKGRLHHVRDGGRVWRGVYAVGRPELTRRGRWMAAALCAGPDAVLSHETAAALWGFRRYGGAREIELTVPASGRRPPGLRVHRRATLAGEDRAAHDGIPVTSPLRTLIDLGTRLQPRQLEAAINEADKLDLIDPEALRAAIKTRAGLHGIASLRTILDRRTFVLTDSELERRFLRLASRAGLPRPETGRYLNGFKVDFYWAKLGLVVETDGLRYHRTPAQQARDRQRDQSHAAAGLMPLRFTHAQVTFHPDDVVGTLIAVSSRLRGRIA